MNMTTFSTQHLAIIELGCHVCCLQQTCLTEAGQVWAREVMRERTWSIVFGQPLDSLLPGKRNQEVLRLLQDPQHMRELCTTERYVRAFIAYGKGDRVIHVVSLATLPKNVEKREL